MIPEGVIRPIELPTALVNHRAPSFPVTMPDGPRTVAFRNVVIAPEVVIRSIENAPRPSVVLVNHSAPSGPATIDSAIWIVGPEKLVIAPDVLIRPIDELFRLVNQSAPSGPAAIDSGFAMLESVYS